MSAQRKQAATLIFEDPEYTKRLQGKHGGADVNKDTWRGSSVIDQFPSHLLFNKRCSWSDVENDFAICKEKQLKCDVKKCRNY